MADNHLQFRSSAYKSLVRKLDRRETFGNPGINKRIILKCILREQVVDRIHLAEDRV
jgi:hypothetical protein